MDQAFQKEHSSNWADAYAQVSDSQVPCNGTLVPSEDHSILADANLITSHVVYKFKMDENGTKDLKARIVPHGNHDSEKVVIRRFINRTNVL